MARLFGREPQLRAVTTLIDDLAAGRGFTAVVDGEAGIGKTALLQRAIGRARDGGVQVFASAGAPAPPRPFDVLVEALHIDGAAPSPTQRRIAALLQSGATVTAPDHWSLIEDHLRQAVLGLLAELADDGPVLLAVDDVDRADPATRRVLGALATRSSDTAIGVLATARPGFELAAPGGADPVRIALDPLDEDAIHDLAADRVGDRLGPRAVTALAGAGGNPLLARLLVRRLLDAGVLAVRPEGVVDLAPGAAVPVLPLSALPELDLGADAMHLLGVASVLGTSFRLRDLAALTGSPAASVWRDLRPAAVAGVLDTSGDDALRFRHPLLRDALYADLPAPVRHALHTEAAERLREFGADFAVVAEHLMRSAHPSGALAVQTLREAARAALAGGDAPTAVELLTAALEAGDAGSRGGLRLARGIALIAAGRHDEGEADLRRTVVAGLDVTDEIAARTALQESALAVGRIADAVADARAAAVSTRFDAATRARFAARVASGLVLARDLDAADAAACDAIADAGAAGDRSAEVSATLVRSHAAAARGRWEPAIRFSGAAVALAGTAELAQEMPDAPRVVHALYLADSGALADAVHNAELAAQALATAGTVAHLVGASSVLGYAHVLAGSWDDARAALVTALGIAVDPGIRWLLEAHCLLALVACEQGVVPDAVAALAEVEQAIARGDRVVRPGMPAWTRAAVHEAQGDLPAAVDVLARYRETSAAAGITGGLAAFGPFLASAAERVGRRDVTAAVAQQLTEQAAGLDGGWPTAAAAWVRGSASGDPDELVAALDAVTSTARRPEHYRCGVDVAVALSRAGRPDDARATARTALAGFAALEARGAHSRAAARLRHAGVVLGVQGARSRPREGWAALTASEREVVRLVADRHTNPEIAALLHVSRRTVAHHVSRALAKLHFASRRQIIDAIERDEDGLGLRSR